MSKIHVLHVCLSFLVSDMSTVQTWTLWQRMPPRYQLTTKSLPDDEDELIVGNSTDRTFTPRKIPSPRPYSGGQSGTYRDDRPRSRNQPTSDDINAASAYGQPRPRSRIERRVSHRDNTAPSSDRAGARDTARSLDQLRLDASQKENFMLSSRSNDEHSNETREVRSTRSGVSFPNRRSDYVTTYQKQRRVNSARRRLAEVPPTSLAPPSRQDSNVADVSGSRAQTAPVFPVTSPDTLKTKPKQNETFYVNKSSYKAVPPKRQISEPSKVDMFQFDDTKVNSATSSRDQMSREFEQKPKKLLVQDTNRATVYIDNGKVLYFGKSRHDLTETLKTQTLRASRANCFLAEIRRDYLRHPKYDRHRKIDLQRLFENDPRRIAHERIDYNRRVENILSYYDEVYYKEPPARPSSSTRNRVKSPIGARVKGLALTPNLAPSRPPSRSTSPVPEVIDITSGDFIRLNQQSKLHERQFYLKTPGIQHGATMGELEKCRCSMCRMELELAIVTGANVPRSGDVGLGISGTQILEKDHPKFGKTKEMSKSGMKATSNAQRVSFKPTECLTKDNRVTINCTLPEMTVSESGFESSRTHDGLSPGPDEGDSIA